MRFWRDVTAGRSGSAVRRIAKHGARSLFFIFGIAATHATVRADDTEAWGAILATGTFADAPQLHYWLEGQGRFNDGIARFNQGIVRAALGYPVAERAILWGGYAFIPNNPAGRSDDILEHRLWQQLTWSAPRTWSQFSLAIRSRLEQRRIESANDTGWRARQLVKITRPVEGYGPLYLSVWDEVFLNLNGTDWGAASGFDQNRLFAGLGFQFSSSLKAEIGYMHQHIRRESAPDRDNHIVSLNLFLNF